MWVWWATAVHFTSHSIHNLISLYVLWKSAQNYYFKMLGNCTVYTKRTWVVIDVLKSATMSKKKEKYEKLHCKSHNGVREASKWSLHFSHIYIDNTASEACENFIHLENDYLFKNEAGLKTFKLFWHTKYPVQLNVVDWYWKHLKQSQLMLSIRAL